MLAKTDRMAPTNMFARPPSAKKAPAEKLTPSVNKLTIFGVMGNLISWRLIGIDTLRFILANTPSVDLNSHWSSFCSASRRSSSDATRCHWSDGTDSQTRPSAAVSQACNSSSVRIPVGHFLSRPIAEGVVKAYMPTGWPSVVSARTLVPNGTGPRFGRAICRQRQNLGPVPFGRTAVKGGMVCPACVDQHDTLFAGRLVRSEEHTSELQSP